MRLRLHIWLLLPLLAGCEKVLFTPEPESDPVSLFQDVWLDYQQHYGPTTFRNVDWLELYATYSPAVKSGSSDEELYLAFTQMLSTLDDGHVQITSPNREHWYSNHYYRERTGFDRFNPEVVRDHYLTSYELEEDVYLKGQTAEGISYIHFAHVAYNMRKLDEVLDNSFSGKLIIDLRHNEGGDFTFALNAFDRLTQERRAVFSSRTKNGPDPGDFTPWHDWHLEPDPRQSFVPCSLVVLIDRFTISAGERATLMLAALPGVTLLGDTTNGALSTMIGREMANGWYYTLATQEILLPADHTLEGIGIPPHQVIVNDPADVSLGHDAVLDSALVRLR